MFEVSLGVFRARVARGGAEEEVRGSGPERRPRGGAGRAGQGRRRKQAPFSISSLDFELATQPQ